MVDYIELLEKKYPVRLTQGAMRSFEARAGISFKELTEEMQTEEGGPSMVDLGVKYGALLITAAIEGGVTALKVINPTEAETIPPLLTIEEIEAVASVSELTAGFFVVLGLLNPEPSLQKMTGNSQNMTEQEKKSIKERIKKPKKKP